MTELSRHALAGGQEPIAETRQTRLDFPESLDYIIALIAGPSA